MLKRQSFLKRYNKVKRLLTSVDEEEMETMRELLSQRSYRVMGLKDK